MFLTGSKCPLHQVVQLQLYLNNLNEERPRHMLSLGMTSKCSDTKTHTDSNLTNFSLFLAQFLLQPDSGHVQTHHPQACGQSHRGVDPWPQWPLVKAVVVLVVGPQAFGAVLSQDLDSKARCDQALRRRPQLHVEVLTQAPQPEVNRFTAAVGVWGAGRS